MSNKQQLPDELLDAIAGGTFTYEGKEVADIRATQDGATIAMRDGSKADVRWNDETRSRFYSGLTGALKTFNEINDKHMTDDATYRLEDYLK